MGQVGDHRTTGSIRRGKLQVPSLGAFVVHRPRINEQLTRSLDVPVTLLVGPAGIGKTTALVEWLPTVQHRTAWLTMDGRDTDFSRFAAHLLGAIEVAIPDFGDRTTRGLESPDRTLTSICEAVAEDLDDLDEPIVLILDDFHESTNSDAARLITEVCTYPPRNLHLVLSSRWDPQIALSRLRGRGQVHEIRAGELRFTQDEARLLLEAVVDGEIDESVVALLHERTDGWIAGLRLAALAMQDRVSMLPEQLAASGERHVMNLLMDEVLSHQPEHIQRVLVYSSILDRIGGSLVEALLDSPGDAAQTEATLRALAASEILTEEAENGHLWYRMHDSFRNLLRHRLSVEISSDAMRELHRKASAWFADNGNIGDAIEHALKANDVDGAADLVERWRLDYLARDKWCEVDQWLRSLPEEVVQGRPFLILTRLRTGAYRGISPRQRPTLADARARVAAVEAELDEASREHLMAELSLVEVYVDQLESVSAETRAFASAALAGLPPTDPLGRGYAMYSLAISMHEMGDSEEALMLLRDALATDTDESGASSSRAMHAESVIALELGQLLRSQQGWQSLARLAEDRGLQLIGGWAQLGLGIVAYELNDLDAAERHFSSILATRHNVGFNAVREAMIGNVLVAYARGKRDAEAAGIEVLLEWILEIGALGDLALVDSIQARLAVLHGDHATASRWMASAPPKVGGTMYWLEIPLLTRVKVLLHDGSAASIEAAIAILHDLERWAVGIHNERRHAEVLLLRALALNARGNASESVDVMAQAMLAFGDEPFTRTFLDLGLDFRPLLRRVRDERGTTPAIERIIALRDASPPVTAVPPAEQPARSKLGLHPNVAVYEMLTEREAEVLRLLSEHLTNQEIADRLYISPLTVKRHASNIYDKLGVRNRRQALIRATELGYLPVD